MVDIVISEFMDEAAVERLSVRYDTLYDPTLVDDRDRLLGCVAGAQALIVRNRTQVDAHVVRTAGTLQCVGRLGVGLDNIDLDICKAKAIEVYPATGANDLAVAEYVITMALVLRRNAYALNRRMIAGHWPRQDAMGNELAGSTIGLIGFGAIARDVATRASALGMAVIAHDPFLKPHDPAWRAARNVGLPELLSAADVISLHTPLTAQTRGLIDAAALAGMKSSGVLINAARGGIVVEEALIAALRTGQLAGAALDVFETEPLSAEEGARFDGLPNLILTPHIAGVSRESNVRVSHLIADKVSAHLDGR